MVHSLVMPQKWMYGTLRNSELSGEDCCNKSQQPNQPVYSKNQEDGNLTLNQLTNISSWFQHLQQHVLVVLRIRNSCFLVDGNVIPRLVSTPPVETPCWNHSSVNVYPTLIESTNGRTSYFPLMKRFVHTSNRPLEARSEQVL